MPTADSKRDLRRAMLERLRAMDSTQRNEQSARLRCAVSPLLHQKDTLTVALYAPMAHEVNLLPLTEQYPQHRYVFPRCTGARCMSFYHVVDVHSQIQPDKRNIPAPIEGLPLIPPNEIDLIIVPGVAFTSTGKRLGYGGGYYDTYLPQCPQAEIIATAFDFQILSDLPTEEHDLHIPRIITPEQI